MNEVFPRVTTSDPIFPRVTPLEPKVNLSACKGQQSELEIGIGERGALLNIALQTHPNLAYAVCRIANYTKAQ